MKNWLYVLTIALLSLLAVIGIGAPSSTSKPQEEARIRAMIEMQGKKYLIDIQGSISIQDVTPSPDGDDDEDPPGDPNNSDNDKGGDPGGLSSVIDGESSPGIDQGTFGFASGSPEDELLQMLIERSR